MTIASPAVAWSGIDRPILMSGAMVRACLREVNPKTQTRRVVKQKHIPFIENILSGLLDGKWNQRPLPYGKPGDRLWVRETLQYGARNNHEPRHNHKWRYAADNALVMVSEAHHTEMLVWACHKEGDVCTSIHMPRWASRLTLEIVKVRVERVQDISEEDAIAEGVERNCPNWNDPEKIKGCPACAPSGICQAKDEFIHEGLGECDFPVTAKEAYRYLWNRINAEPKPVKEKTPKGWLVTHYESFPWSEEDFARLYPKYHQTRMVRGKPLKIIANPWVWVIEFKRVTA